MMMAIALVVFQMTFPDWIFVAPGIQGQSNPTIGQKAYDMCVKPNNPSTVVCEAARAQAINSDIHDRWKMFVGELIAGRIVDAHSLDVYLNYYKFRFTEAFPNPSTLPFGGIQPTFNTNPQANPAQVLPF